MRSAGGDGEGTIDPPGGFRLRPFLERWWPAFLIGGLVLGLLYFAYVWLDDLVRASGDSPWPILVEQLTGGLGAGVLLPAVIWTSLGWRLDRVDWPRKLPVHLVALGAFSALKTTWNWASRSALFPVLGLGPYDYGAMPLRYLMEFPLDLLLYVIAVTVTYLVVRAYRARDQEVALSRLQARLAETRLAALRAQLRPHFLFNTLNAVSSLMYEDVERADAMLAALGDLLRWTMEPDPRAGEVTLDEELEMAGHYADLMKLRLGDRLQVDVGVPANLRQLRVPRFLLQPLVENAILHGDPGAPAPARVRVTGSRRDDVLSLAVEDNGPGFPDSDEVEPGTGLRNARALLAETHGDDAELRLESSPWGGARVVVEMPVTGAGSGAAGGPGGPR